MRCEAPCETCTQSNTHTHTRLMHSLRACMKMHLRDDGLYALWMPTNIPTYIFTCPLSISLFLPSCNCNIYVNFNEVEWRKIKHYHHRHHHHSRFRVQTSLAVSFRCLCGARCMYIYGLVVLFFIFNESTCPLFLVSNMVSRRIAQKRCDDDGVLVCGGDMRSVIFGS